MLINKSGNKPYLINSGVECPPATMPKHSFASLVGANLGSSILTLHMNPASMSDVYSSAPDSVLVPSPSSHLSGGTMGSVKLEMSQRAGFETNMPPELVEPMSLSTHDDSLVVNSSNLESQSSLQFADPLKGTILLHNSCNSLKIFCPNYINGVSNFCLLKD